MTKIISWLNESSYIEPLSPGCRMCAQGSKMVVLVTGLCSSNCFYCPLSLRKIGKDRIFTDEWELTDEKDTNKLIQEAKYIKATGAGITGGDPLLVWKRTRNFITLLKETFGKDFHIHLYTSGLKNINYINDLVSAGLDEIRFHPSPNYWRNIRDSPIYIGIKEAIDSSVDVAFEIPVIPDMEKQIFSLINWCNKTGVKWINLNELEFSETNTEQLKNKNFTVKNDISAAVNGSQEVAYRILKWIAAKENIQTGIHYCSSSFKDGVQLKNRIARRARSIAHEYEIITDEGTLIKGVIETIGLSLEEAMIILKREFEVEAKYLFLNKEKKRIEIGVWILEEIAADLKNYKMNSFMIEEYPTADSLEVERIPLPL